MTQEDLQQKYMIDEECIIINERDEEIGHESKLFCHLTSNIVNDAVPTLHRAFSIFIFNEKGELLLQQRAGEKKVRYSSWFVS
jgi:isopentenyl-diphosphate delta-isomerase